MTQINQTLDIDSLQITAQCFNKNGDIILDVLSKNTHSICHKCGKLATKPNGMEPRRLIRHLPILGTPVYLRIKPVRYSCEQCDGHPTTTEQYDWCHKNSSITKKIRRICDALLVIGCNFRIHIIRTSKGNCDFTR